jgi:hypothetical protein
MELNVPSVTTAVKDARVLKLRTVWLVLIPVLSLRQVAQEILVYVSAVLDVRMKMDAVIKLVTPYLTAIIILLSTALINTEETLMVIIQSTQTVNKYGNVAHAMKLALVHALDQKVIIVLIRQMQQQVVLLLI